MSHWLNPRNVLALDTNNNNVSHNDVCVYLQAAQKVSSGHKFERLLPWWSTTVLLQVNLHRVHPPLEEQQHAVHDPHDEVRGAAKRTYRGDVWWFDRLSGERREEFALHLMFNDVGWHRTGNWKDEKSYSGVIIRFQSHIVWCNSIYTCCWYISFHILYRWVNRKEDFNKTPHRAHYDVCVSSITAILHILL